VRFARALAAAAIALAVMARGSIAAAQPPTLTLAQAQHMALQEHPQIKVAQFDVAAAQEGINIARAAYAPQVYGSAVSTLAKPDTRVGAYVNGITDPTVLQRTAAGLLVSQYITDFGRTAAVVRTYQLGAKSQAERSAATRLTVLLNVTQAYFEVLRAEALLRVALETVRERDTLLRQISALQHAGLRSTLDVSIAQRDLASARQILVEARARRRDTMASLSEAMGSPVDTDYTLVEPHALPAIPSSVGPLIDEMLADNPALQAERTTAAQAASNATAVAKQTSPVVEGYGYFGGTPIRAMNQQINSAYATAGISLVVPIANGGELKAEARQAQDQALSASAAVVDEQNQLLSQTRVAYEDVVAARSNIDATRQIVVTARQTLALTEARYRIGLNSIVDLSQAQLLETQGEIDYQNAIYDYIEQGAGLEFVIGALAPAA